MNAFRFLKAMAIALKLSCICTVLLFNSAGATADESKLQSMRLDHVIRIDESGNASMEDSIRLTDELFTAVNGNQQVAGELLHDIKQLHVWTISENCRIEFDESKRTVHSEYKVLGIVRLVDADLWQLSLVAFDPNLEVIDIDGQSVILGRAIDMSFGVAQETTRIQLPANSHDIEFDASTSSLTYRFSPTEPTGEKTAFEFRVDGKEHLMSSLASVYADEQFENLWTARGMFQNTGETTISDLRIRFRISGFSGWSSWNKTKLVYPGQTVVEPYFPVLDMDAVSRVSSTRPVQIEVEFQFTNEAGELVEESDSHRLQLLSPNEVVFSGTKQTEKRSWSESWEYLPMVVAAFTNSEDPAIQQLAGRISGVAGGVAASSSNEEALVFLRALWTFLEVNNIAYQTPPSFLVDETVGQHIKFGRDVLRNRAGTCIDLTILVASTAKAVGLKSYIMLTPGHAFPVFELPDGTILPVEATTIGQGTFDDAISYGSKVYDEAWKGDHMIVDIDQLQSSGVRCLDLPTISNSYLEELGFVFTYGESFSSSGSADSNEVSTSNEVPDVSALDLLGTWFATNESASVGIQLTFETSGMVIVRRFKLQDGVWKETSRENSNWTIDGIELRIENSTSTSKFQVSLEPDGQVLLLIMENPGASDYPVLEYKRTK